MDTLPPIPIPSGQRWREFRLRAIPIIVFLDGFERGGDHLAGVCFSSDLDGRGGSHPGKCRQPEGRHIVPTQCHKLSVGQSRRRGRLCHHDGSQDFGVITRRVIQAEIGLMRVNLEPILGQQRYVPELRPCASGLDGTKGRSGDSQGQTPARRQRAPAHGRIVQGKNRLRTGP